jgi:hypothetical protein
MHVGMHVRLHGTSNWAQYWLRNALDVTWPKQQGVLSHIKRGFLNSVFINLNTLKGKPSLFFKVNHELINHTSNILICLLQASLKIIPCLSIRDEFILHLNFEMLLQKLR